MRKKIINTSTNTFETRDYMLINPSWFGVLFDLPTEEVGKIFFNLCIIYGKQPNHKLLEMDEKTTLVFRMMLADQDNLDLVAKLPDSREVVDE